MYLQTTSLTINTLLAKYKMVRARLVLSYMYAFSDNFSSDGAAETPKGIHHKL